MNLSIPTTNRVPKFYDQFFKRGDQNMVWWELAHQPLLWTELCSPKIHVLKPQPQCDGFGDGTSGQ